MSKGGAHFASVHGEPLSVFVWYFLDVGVQELASVASEQQMSDLAVGSGKLKNIDDLPLLAQARVVSLGYM